METRWARVAGLFFKFEAGGCRFAPSFAKGFECQAPEDDGADIVTVGVSIVDSIEIPARGETLFTGHVPASDDNPLTHWTISKDDKGREVLTLVCGAQEGVRMARIAWIGCSAEMTISRHLPKSAPVSPFVFPIINIFLARLLALRGGFLIHSSVVDYRGRGLLFTAVSGTGKSSIARIFEREGATVVNDDMNAVRTDADGHAVAYNIPLPAYSQTPKSVRLSGLFAISQSPTNVCQPLSGARAIISMAVNTIQQPFDALNASRHLDNVVAAFAPVPTFSLGFKPDSEVVSVAYGNLEEGGL